MTLPSLPSGVKHAQKILHLDLAITMVSVLVVGINLGVFSLFFPLMMSIFLFLCFMTFCNSA